MSSEKRIAANRRNAQLSTGPKTAAGRAKASMNALKHGVLARRMVLSDEDPQELAELEARTCEALAPEGQFETALAERVVACLWRLRRVCDVETAVFGRLAAEETRQYDWRMLDPFRIDEVFPAAPPDIGSAFLADADKGNALSKLSRYEVSLERSMYRALHELQRMQAERGARASAPAAVDVDVDVLVRDDVDRGHP